MPIDRPVDQTTAPRAVVATVLINGVPTQLAMPVVSVSDADGRTIDFALQNLFDVMLRVLNEQRATNTMLSVMSGVPYTPTPDDATTFSAANPLGV